jgi:hypothetical protein
MNEIRRRTRFEAAQVALRLARSIAARFGIALDAAHEQSDADAPLAAALRFAVRLAAEHAAGDGGGMPSHPLARIRATAPTRDVGERVADLVLLAALPEMHEGYAALMRHVHPEGRPYPTATLALHWLEHEAQDASAAMRELVEELLVHSAMARVGLVRLEGEGPWHGRTLRPGPGVWDALDARPPRLDCAEPVPGLRGVPGLDAWLAQPDARRAVRVLQSGEPCIVAILGETEAMRATRMRALLGAAGLGAVRTRLDASMTAHARADAVTDAYCAGFMHRACPWAEIDAQLEAPAFAAAAGFEWDMPLLATAAEERALPSLELPIVLLRAEPMRALARRAMWSAMLPELEAAAGVLAARYPIDAEECRGVVSDLALRQRVASPGDGGLSIDDIGACLRARTGWRSRPGVRRIIPRADWKDLLVPQASSAQLSEAVLRIHQQLTVLDDWGFEQGRRERRGLRLLFYGPPGTGKTLAAEAMARALGVDLLAVDIASLVSKWIGETEKNLAAVFEVAEASRALLLFDEADALFGRRTEGHDANDRYANLETAFLLQRLERYEGVAVLATNLRASLDPAFTRRFEFIVEFPEPDHATRAKLWRLHLPADAPLADDVDLRALADWFAMSGAQIRNAALGAAFLAAAERDGPGPRIGQRHFLRSIEREYEKAGKAHPGNPPASRTAAAR